MDSAVARKTERYAELLGTCRDAGYKANLLTLEVDSRGFSNTDSFDKHYHAVIFLPPEPNRRWHARACYSPFGSGASATGKSQPCYYRLDHLFLPCSPCVHVVCIALSFFIMYLF